MANALSLATFFSIQAHIILGTGGLHSQPYTCSREAFSYTSLGYTKNVSYMCPNTDRALQPLLNELFYYLTDGRSKMKGSEHVTHIGAALLNASSNHILCHPSSRRGKFIDLPKEPSV